MELEEGKRYKGTLHKVGWHLSPRKDCQYHIGDLMDKCPLPIEVYIQYINTYYTNFTLYYEGNLYPESQIKDNIVLSYNEKTRQFLWNPEPFITLDPIEEATKIPLAVHPKSLAKQNSSVGVTKCAKCNGQLKIVSGFISQMKFCPVCEK